jgi:hypothetical protein
MLTELRPIIKNIFLTWSMRIALLIIFSAFLMSASGDKNPRKIRGVFQGTLESYSIGQGDLRIDVSDANVTVVISKLSAVMYLEGRKYALTLTENELVENDVTGTKEYVCSVELPVPFEKSVFHIDKKGKQITWKVSSLKDVILLKSK